MRTPRLFAYAFVAVLGLLSAGSAMADVGSGDFNAFLKGTYQLSANSSCSSGPNPGSIGSDPTSFITFAGVITYDGRGHATVTDQGVVIGTGSPDRFDEACKYEYEVARDGSFSQTGFCTDANKTFLLSGIKWNGQIGVGGSVLTTNMVGMDVHTFAVPPGNIISYSICGGVGTAVRIYP